MRFRCTRLDWKVRQRLQLHWRIGKDKKNLCAINLCVWFAAVFANSLLGKFFHILVHSLCDLVKGFYRYFLIAYQLYTVQLLSKSNQNSAIHPVFVRTTFATTHLHTRTRDDHSNDSCISPNSTTWTLWVVVCPLCIGCTGSTNPVWSRPCRVHIGRCVAACSVGSSAPPGWRNSGNPSWGSRGFPETLPAAATVAILVRNGTAVIRWARWCTAEMKFSSWCCVL